MGLPIYQSNNLPIEGLYAGAGQRKEQEDVYQLGGHSRGVKGFCVPYLVWISLTSTSLMVRFERSRSTSQYVSIGECSSPLPSTDDEDWGGGDGVASRLALLRVFFN